MGQQTARAGIHQLCGGGIDNDDLRGDYFDFEHNITKELVEELNIDVSDKNRVKEFHEEYFKEGGPTDKMTVVFKVVLNETKNEFLENYNNFAKDLKDGGEDLEFGKIIALKKDGAEIEKFLSRDDIKIEEYMKPLFEKVVEEMSC